MSMISSLIDELNKSADEWNGSNMFELARMCREAADTITELRGALQVASVDYRHLSEENAKLREQGARLFDKTLELGTENAKLRELARDMYGFIQSMDEDCGDVIFSDCFDYCKHEAADDGCRKIGKCWYDRRMHELGVEVDG